MHFTGTKSLPKILLLLKYKKCSADVKSDANVGHVMYTFFIYIFPPMALVLLFVMSRHTYCLVYLFIYILMFKL